MTAKPSFRFTFAVPALVALLSGCEATQQLAKDLAEDLDNALAAAEAEAGGDGAEATPAALAATHGDAQAADASAPLSGSKSTTIGALFEGDPPFVFTYMPFSAMVTTTVEEKELIAEPKLPAPLEGVVVKPAKGERLYTVRIEGVEDVLAQQKHAEWCWAACSQAVNKQEARMGHVKFDGEHPTQEQLAEYFKGDSEDQTAPVATIMRAINLDLEVGPLAENGATLQVAGNLMTTDAMVEALLEGRLAIVGLEYHACVVVGATYGYVVGGDADEDLQELGETLQGLGETLGELGLDDDMADSGDDLHAIGELSGELLSRYAVHEVFFIDPLHEGEVKRMGANELKARCKVIMTSELARKILLGEGFTGQETLGQSLEDELMEDME
jgi:hypothetical protein